MSHRDYEALLQKIGNCAMECQHCVYNICLGDPNMKTCGQMCIDCAMICAITAAFIGRGSKFCKELAGVCAGICEECESECRKFQTEDMLRCADICRDCAEACRDFVAA